MNQPNAMSSPKIRPKVLLWTLIVCNAAMTVSSVVIAWHMEREASIVVVREPEMRARIEQAKTRIQTETDIEKLRSLALLSRDSKFEEWRDVGYRYHQMSGACLLYTSPSPRDRTRSRMPSSA